MFEMFNGEELDAFTLYIVNEEERRDQLDEIAAFMRKSRMPVGSWAVQVAATELSYEAPNFEETQYILDKLGE